MNGILCINKPQEWTSFDVVNKLSRIFKVKVGHTGTLDPMATGVLVCLINNTKVLPFLDMNKKRYIATCTLGVQTDTGDIWGKTLKNQSITAFTQNTLLESLNSFIGKQQQKVPMTSAKKLKGRKLYEYQREKIEIDPLFQDIEIFEIKLLEYQKDSFTFEALVSSGTYMRTLCEDIASKLENIGTLSALIRTECGQFQLSDCYEINSVKLTTKLIPIDIGLRHYPSIYTDNDKAVLNGQKIENEYIGDLVTIKNKEQLLAIYEYDKINKIYKNKRGLWV